MDLNPYRSPVADVEVEKPTVPWKPYGPSRLVTSSLFAGLFIGSGVGAIAGGVLGLVSCLVWWAEIILPDDGLSRLEVVFSWCNAGVFAGAIAGSVAGTFIGAVTGLVFLWVPPSHRQVSGWISASLGGAIVVTLAALASGPLPRTVLGLVLLVCFASGAAVALWIHRGLVLLSQPSRPGTSRETGTRLT